MKMNPGCTLLAARDLEVSKRFYKEMFGWEVELDLGSNVALSGGIALQELGSWATFLLDRPADEIRLGGNDMEIVLETEDMDGFLALLEQHPEVQLVHGVRTYPWGQRVVRVYDPDQHILEVGESMKLVVKRFVQQGMTDAEILEKTQFPPEFLAMCKEEMKGEGAL